MKDVLWALMVFVISVSVGVALMIGWIELQTWRNRRRYERMQSRLTLPYDRTGKDRLI